MADEKPTGTREWASINHNFQNRCEHGCIYCYACANAIRFGRCENYTEWATKAPSINMDKVNKRWQKRNGTIMFPTTHDITPLNIDYAVTCLRHMIEAGNNVLIVSKPHLTCIQTICENFEAYKDQILFRFTIGSIDSKTLKFWEPGAPSYEERKCCLMAVFKAGFKTSVSAEPYLDEHVVDLVPELTPFINDALWFGPMNKMRTRVAFRGISYKYAYLAQIPSSGKDGFSGKYRWTPEEWEHWNVAESVQTEKYIRNLYDTFKDNPKVRWKNRIKEVLGLPIPKEIGLDV